MHLSHPAHLPHPAHPPLSDERPRFVTGSPFRHVIVMAGTGAVGLLAIFGVDLLNLFYISLLGHQAIAAAIGFAGTVSFFQISLSIGMTIGVAAIVSREIGAGRMEDARRIAGASLAVMVATLLVVGLATVALLGPILDSLGATGETKAQAARYLGITSLSLPLMAMGMGCSALLRSVGDARRSMNVTLIGAVVTAALDPVLILLLHLDLEGAAISTIFSRAALAWLGLHGVTRAHRLVGAVHWRSVLSDSKAMLRIAGPAILTNLATPVGAAFVTRNMAAFGSDAVAGQATIDRISPVAFAMVYALSGSIGPIVAQNLGAGHFSRVREALRDAMLVVVATVLAAWLVLDLAQNLVVMAFSLRDTAAVLVHLFCTLLAASFLFIGMLYVANAAFNNLGFPFLSMLFNWGRATLGTIPFVAYGARSGPSGILYGQAAGSVIFGLAAAATAWQVTRHLERRHPVPPTGVAVPPAASGSTALGVFADRPTASETVPATEPDTP